MSGLKACHALIGYLAVWATVNKCYGLSFATKQYVIDVRQRKWTSSATQLTLAQFDDLRYRLGNSNQITTYAGLQWDNVNLYQPINNSEIGLSVIPSSGSKYAVGGLNNGIATLTTSFLGSASAFFDLHWFSWACLRAEPRTIRHFMPETATDCYLTLRGWEPSKNGREHGHESITYFLLVDQYRRDFGVRMQKVNLGGHFAACQRIEFEVRSFASQDVVLLVDDLFYRTYNVTRFEREWPGIGQLRHDNGPLGIA